MRGLLALLMLFLLAGCVGKEGGTLPQASLPATVGASPSADPSEAAFPEAVAAFPRDLGESRSKLTLGGCLPEGLPTGTRCPDAGLMTTTASFHPWENESALARQGGMEWVVVAEWTPTHPNAAALGIKVTRDFEVVGHAEGSSPVEVRFAADGLSPMGTYYLDFVPAPGAVVDQSVRFFLDLRPAVRD